MSDWAILACGLSLYSTPTYHHTSLALSNVSPGDVRSRHLVMGRGHQTQGPSGDVREDFLRWEEPSWEAERYDVTSCYPQRLNIILFSGSGRSSSSGPASQLRSLKPFSSHSHHHHLYREHSPPAENHLLLDWSLCISVQISAFNYSSSSVCSPLINVSF